jgi:hypothetical protein
MHQLIATLFSLLVALCHHTSLTARPVEAAELPGTVVTSSSDATSPAMILPDRYQLAHGTQDGSYAEAACASCRRMNVSSIER